MPFRLPFLDININPAKALRYFRICDTDGSGEIDIDEFKVALFLCDPVSINSSVRSIETDCTLNGSDKW